MALIPYSKHRLLLSFRDIYIKTRLLATNIKNGILYNNPPKTYDLISVDPANITWTISWNSLENQKKIDRPDFFDKGAARLAGTVRGGDWDKNLKSFENCVVYESFVSHFIEGVSWEETYLFQQSIEQISQGEFFWGCKSVGEFERRCERLDDLFDNIKHHGYKSQGELHPRSDPFNSTRQNAVSNLENEIIIHIGRDGNLIFYDGRNRLSIAKILNLESIPVVVGIRHQKWQQLRESVSNGEKAVVTESIRNHPDLRNIS